MRTRGAHEAGGGAAVRDRSLLVAAPAPQLEPLGPPGRYQRFVKPVIDRVGAAVLLTVLLPVMAVVSVVVAAQLGRPLVFRQARVGLNGRVFGVYKFRTMRPDRRTTTYEPVVHERRVTHKHPDDPRLVPVGRFLRRWSLDELPQLINVLRGEMSLVGPRPELVSVVNRHYAPWQHERHRVKPGVTGLWQITDRDSGEEMYKNTETDLQYLRRISLWEDLRILVLTVPAALGMKRGF